MSRLSERYSLHQATAADRVELTALYRSGHYPGALAVQYLHEPDLLASLNDEADRAIVLLVRDREAGGQLVGAGTCTVRPGQINGETCRLAYLGGLRSFPDYQGKMLPIASVYQALHQLIRDQVDVTYTTILAENQAALKMLTKRRQRMPDYLHQGDLTVFCLKTLKPQRVHLPAACRIEQLDLTDWTKLWDQEPLLRRGSLSSAAPFVPALQRAQFFVLYEQSRVIGWSYLLDQRRLKQYEVIAYRGLLALASHLPTNWLGYPRFPRPGATVPLLAGALGGFDLTAAQVHALLDLTLAEAHRAADPDLPPPELVIFAIANTSPLHKYLLTRKQVHFQSKVFEVDWQKTNQQSDWQDLLPEVALL